MCLIPRCHGNLVISTRIQGSKFQRNKCANSLHIDDKLCEITWLNHVTHFSNVDHSHGRNPNTDANTL